PAGTPASTARAPTSRVTTATASARWAATTWPPPSRGPTKSEADPPPAAELPGLRGSRPGPAARAHRRLWRERRRQVDAYRGGQVLPLRTGPHVERRDPHVGCERRLCGRGRVRTRGPPVRRAAHDLGRELH